MIITKPKYVVCSLFAHHTPRAARATQYLAGLARLVDDLPKTWPGWRLLLLVDQESMGRVWPREWPLIERALGIKAPLVQVEQIMGWHALLGGAQTTHTPAPTGPAGQQASTDLGQRQLPGLAGTLARLLPLTWPVNAQAIACRDLDNRLTREDFDHVEKWLRSPRRTWVHRYDLRHEPYWPVIAGGVCFRLADLDRTGQTDQQFSVNASIPAQPLLRTHDTGVFASNGTLVDRNRRLAAALDTFLASERDFAYFVDQRFLRQVIPVQDTDLVTTTVLDGPEAYRRVMPEVAPVKVSRVLSVCLALLRQSDRCQAT